ncbi:hypothetical protein RU97_GL000706 [Enterococcus canis]|uniref:DUF1801 domain-containing protein n=1 Tax=Enterococcus canis TaxID=214095 RepID=A0A1L8RHE8_9ENTE|nr:hypothetical protein [Enterococcus canis]OJG19135.1 hypothetical protein RU97_GL000706 [Enterococcus canis]
MEKQVLTSYMAHLTPEDLAIIEQLDQLIRTTAKVESYILTGMRNGSTEPMIGYHKNKSQLDHAPEERTFLIGLAKDSEEFKVYVNAVKHNRFLVNHYRDQLGEVNVYSNTLAFRHLDQVDRVVFTEMIREACSLYS